MQVLASPEKLCPRDADEEEHGGVEDMTRLAYLNEPGVLYNLKRRYTLNDIYVSVKIDWVGFCFIDRLRLRVCLDWRFFYNLTSV